MSFPRLALHTVTTKPWSIYQCIENYARRGIGGISIWRDAVEGEELARVKNAVRDAGLTPISLVRGGFFTGKTKEEREAALQVNREALHEAEALGLSSLVLVTGATVGQGPVQNYQQISDGIGALTQEAEDCGVRLLIEPLHPIYAADRSGIPSLAVANQLCEELDSKWVAIAADVYHIWWELDLEQQLRKAGKKGFLGSYHICDFKPDQTDPLLDRGIMGEGAVQLAEIDRWVAAAGFRGFREVEIFSSKWWQADQDDFLDRILAAYTKLYPSDL